MEPFLLHNMFYHYFFSSMHWSFHERKDYMCFKWLFKTKKKDLIDNIYIYIPHVFVLGLDSVYFCVLKSVVEKI